MYVYTLDGYILMFIEWHRTRLLEPMTLIMNLRMYKLDGCLP